MAGGVVTMEAQTSTDAGTGLLRRFGLTVGAIFGLIGLWPVLWRQASPRGWALVVATILIGLGGLRPRALDPVYRAWMSIGRALGWLNTRLILGATFFLLLTPIGLLMRLMGRDPLDRRLRDRKTYWVVREGRRDSGQAMERWF